MAENVIHILPYKYIHVQDNNSNISRLEVGPATFIRKEHETIMEGPSNMIILLPLTYCKIADPVIRSKDGRPELTPFGQVKTNQGEFEYRTAEKYPEPFPLFPGEKLLGKIEQLLVIQPNEALRLVAARDFIDGEVKRVAGSEWQRKGPFIYIPRVEEEVVSIVKAEVIKPNTALKLKALKDTKDNKGGERKVGEEWLVRDSGSYLPDVNEKVVEIVKGQIITDRICLHLQAQKKFKDCYGKVREAGEEWLITNDMASTHIQDVHERVMGVENLITLSSRDYCVVVNPMDPKTLKNKWGTRMLKKGELVFFLQPGEKLEKGIEKVKVLGEDEALLLLARTSFVDDIKEKRAAGEKWMIHGPRDYVPPIEVEILETRKSIPLDENEGIYVRDNRTGEVRMITGQTYLLQAHESLWSKELSPIVEKLLAEANSGTRLEGNGVLPGKEYKRDPTRIVTYKAQHSSAVQLFDYKLNKSRVVFGPDLVMLGPDEEFTVITLSGGWPKVEGAIKALSLLLGPDFMGDVVIVETSDHARLALCLALNWYFKFDKKNPLHHEKIFSVKDFVADVCKTIGSRVRGAVSGITFEDFHHHSAIKIREAVFGKNKDGTIREELFFESNFLTITSVDIQTVEITDEKTRKYLSQSINQAIEINTKSQEANSKHQAERLDQEAKGQLLRQKLEDDARAEESMIKLLELQAESAVVSSRGQAVANANAKAEAEFIACQAEVKQAELKSLAMEFEGNSDIEQLVKNQKAEIELKKASYDLEILKAKENAEIEMNKFKRIVNSIGADTIVSIAKAGPETKLKLLQGLGLKGYLVSDGKNPINLFNTANGFLGEKK